eukprot:jgi/Ulvmu1/2625/UM014_0077.1
MSRFTANGTILLGDQVRQCYEGDKDQGLRHGHGAYNYANAAFRYEGEYFKGKKHGKGRLTLSDGSYFEGDFEHDEIVGLGVRVHSDGSRHEGQFVDGEASGQGVYRSAQGWTIHANFAENRAVGHGTWENSDGDKYEGTFDGKFSGQGILQCTNGYTYQGQWTCGEKNGHGFEQTNGETYQGQFCNDRRHGIGTLTTADGRTYREAAFVEGAIGHRAGRMQLEYEKSVDKKGTEVPLQLEAGNRVPAAFAVRVAVESKERDAARAPGEAACTTAEEGVCGWQLLASESGRRVRVQLHIGHPQEGQGPGEQVQGDALGMWRKSTSTEDAGNEPAADQVQAPEQLEMEPEVHLFTESGVCTFTDFQIGGGETEVAPGAYTLVFSSDGIPSEMLAIAVGGKGKGK